MIGRDWASVDDCFNLCDQGDERVNLEWIFCTLSGKMMLEEWDDALPDAALVWRARRDEGPHDANALQFRRCRQIPRVKLLLDDGIGARKVWPVVADEVFDGRASGGESADRLDDGIGVVLEDDFGVDASGFEACED